jgi:hypothetical protein
MMFPDEHRKLMRRTNGFSAGPVAFYGVGRVATVSRPDGSYAIMATIEVGDLASKVGDFSGGLYFLDAESDLPTPLRERPVRSIQRLCTSTPG